MVSVRAERRLFQIAVMIGALVPIIAGGAGAFFGVVMFHGVRSATADLDSHFRYLSGLLLGIGFAFVFCVIRIEQRSVLFRTLGFIVITGGLARLLGAAIEGMPSGAHRFALIMELLVVPGLLLWLQRVDRRLRQPSGSGLRA